MSGRLRLLSLEHYRLSPIDIRADDSGSGSGGPLKLERR
jgi:hypothetical protein